SLDPVVHILDVIVWVERHASSPTQVERGHFRSKLLERVSRISEALAELAVQPRRVAGRMGALVKQDGHVITIRPEGQALGHLDSVLAWGVVGLVAAMGNWHAQVVN